MKSGGNGSRILVKPTLQTNEEVDLGRLGHVYNCTVRQNQVKSNNDVDGETGLVGVSIDDLLV